MKNTLAILILLLSAGTSLAGGKLYARERVPPDIPYQRALILYQDGKETLVLQSKFEGRLTPEQMHTDLAFVPAPDNTGYREHIIKW